MGYRGKFIQNIVASLLFYFSYCNFDSGKDWVNKLQDSFCSSGLSGINIFAVTIVFLSFISFSTDAKTLPKTHNNLLYSYIQLSVSGSSFLNNE